MRKRKKTYFIGEMNINIKSAVEFKINQGSVGYTHTHTLFVQFEEG
jgi:hypothetical protein